MKKHFLIALMLIPLMSFGQNRVQTYIDEQMKGFNTFIPSMHILKLGIFRYAYLKCKLTGEDWRTFGDVYAERYTRKKRIIAWIFSWL